LVKNFLHFQNTFQTVHIYRSGGDLISHHRRDGFPEYKPEKSFYMHKDREFVELAERVIKNRKSETSQVLYTGTRRRPFQTYVVPLFAQGKDGPVWGLLSGAVFLPLPRFDALINGLALSRNNFLVVTDKVGGIVMANGLEEFTENPFLKTHLEHLAHNLQDAKNVSQKEELVDHHGPDFNFPFILVSQRFHEADLVVTLGVNTEAIEHKKRLLIQYLFVGYTGCLLLLLFLSILVSRRISRPLDEISQTIRQLSLGNFSYRVKENKADELGHMGSLVNKLAEKMEKDRYLGYLWGTEDEVDEILKGHD
jgi:HAMP domain-containing protein